MELVFLNCFNTIFELSYTVILFLNCCNANFDLLYDYSWLVVILFLTWCYTIFDLNYYFWLVVILFFICCNAIFDLFSYCNTIFDLLWYCFWLVVILFLTCCDTVFDLLYIVYHRPGPNSPLSWMESCVLALAPEDNPEVRQKILLGLNFYGNEYSAGGGGPIVGNQ